LKDGTVFNLETILANQTIPALNSIYATVSVNTSTVGIITDTLIVVAEYPNCNDTLRIPIFANVLGEPAEVKFYIRASEHPKTDPTRRNYRVPIYIKADENVSGAVIEKLVIEVDRNLYFPRRVDNGVLSTNLDGSTLEMIFENVVVPDLIANEEKVLLIIRGDVILGHKDSSEITVVSADFADGTLNNGLQPIVELIHGFITLDICREGSDRLIVTADYDPSLTVMVNPVVDGILEVKCEVIEVGNYSLEIIDLLGKSLTVKRFTVTRDSAKIFDFSFPVLNYGNGAYMIILHTPSSMKFLEKFIIGK
jgi:hypothetical protein